MDSESPAHTKWNCKYHIVFAPKYRRLVIYGRIKNEIGRMLRTLCERKGIVILEAEACPDHIHMLVTIPPKTSVSSAMGYLKGKSSPMIFDRFANLKYRYGNRVFWCRWYYVDPVGDEPRTRIREFCLIGEKQERCCRKLSLKRLKRPLWTNGGVKRLLVSTP